MQYVAVRCNVSRCAALRCSVLQCVAGAVCIPCECQEPDNAQLGSMSQCVAVLAVRCSACSALKCVD